MSEFNHPLMEENVNREDVNEVIKFLQQDPLPKFTNGPKVAEFEQKWGGWQGNRFNTMVNSGSMANEISLLALKYFNTKGGEVILSPLGWVSDVAAILHAGFDPVFCDINLKNFSIDVDDFRRKITHKTKALLLVHVLGFNGLNDDIINICQEKGIRLIEDCCESHGATFKGVKVGNFGLMNNFSYFYAHHLCSFAEGGMIGTNTEEIHNIVRSMRSHGMLRELPNERFRMGVTQDNPSLNPDFIFLAAAHNGRSQEVNAVVALNQLKRLDENNKKRSNNLLYFLSKLDSNKYLTNLDTEGNSNYAFTVVLKQRLDYQGWQKVEQALRENKIEFRRGLSGGGSQIRQPYLKDLELNPFNFPNTEHVHFCSAYVGNYPTLPKEKIDNLLNVLNNVNL